MYNKNNKENDYYDIRYNQSYQQDMYYSYHKPIRFFGFNVIDKTKKNKNNNSDK